MMPTFAYTPTPPPLTQDELDALAAQQRAMGGSAPSGGYVAPPPPPPTYASDAMSDPNYTGYVPSPVMASPQPAASPPQHVVVAPPQWDTTLAGQPKSGTPAGQQPLVPPFVADRRDNPPGPLPTERPVWEGLATGLGDVWRGSEGVRNAAGTLTGVYHPQPSSVPPPPPPARAEHPVWEVLPEGLGGAWQATEGARNALGTLTGVYRGPLSQPTAAPLTAASPPAGTATLNMLAPVGAVKDAATASPVGQTIGNVLGAQLPFADQLPPPPTEVGRRLAAGDPGGAAQLVGDVAGANPLLTASLVAAPMAAPWLASAPSALGLLGRAAALGGVGLFGAMQQGVPPPWETLTPQQKARRDQNARDAAAGTTGTPGTAPAPAIAPATRTPPATTATRPTSTPSGPTGATGTGGASIRPASSPPPNAAPQTIAAAPARTPASSAPIVTAPARSSAPPPAGAGTSDDLLATLGLLDDPVDLSSAGPFSGGDFTGRLADLPGLGNVGPLMAARMARLTNARLRRRRGKRTGAFAMERGDLHRVITESVFAALRGERA
jgi:hypothetical protein